MREPILQAGALVAYTCPDCPGWDEPIRREVTGSGRVRFVVVVAEPRVTGQSRRQVKRRVDTLTEARDVVAAVRAGTYTAPVAPVRAETVRELCARWLASRTDVRQVTREGYEGALASTLRRIGDRPVTSLTGADVDALIGWLSTEGGKRGQPLSPRSVRAAMVALGQAVDVAVRDGVVDRNVVRLAHRPRQRRIVGTDLPHWQPAELMTFRDAADRDPLAGAWRLTLSGMTRSDVMGLRWSDVDLDAGQVTIAQGRVALGSGDTIDDPKSEQRRRTIPVEQIHPGTVALLRTMRAGQAADRLAAGRAWTDSGLVVVDALGRGIRPEVYSDRFRRLCVTAGVPGIRLHAVRHSLAFILSAEGVIAADAAALLGHRVEVYLSTYLPQSGPTRIAAAAARLSVFTAARPAAVR